MCILAAHFFDILCHFDRGTFSNGEGGFIAPAVSPHSMGMQSAAVIGAWLTLIVHRRASARRENVWAGGGGG